MAVSHLNLISSSTGQAWVEEKRSNCSRNIKVLTSISRKNTLHCSPCTNISVTLLAIFRVSLQ